MVEVGKLVKEHTAPDRQPRLGTVTKVTDIILNKNSQWKVEVDRWVAHHDPLSGSNDDIDMSGCFIVRPGQVVSVRWQDNAKMTIHVFYKDAKGLSTVSTGGNSIEMFARASE